VSDTSVLNRLFHQRATIQTEPYHGKKKVTLTEPQAADSSIEIHNLPEDAIVIDLDGALSNEKLFSGTKSECKRADYIIFSELRRTILFIEMKRSGAKRKDITNQLKGSLCAFEYTQAVAREFFDESGFLATYQRRFISIKHTGIKSRKTEIEKTAGTHNAPDKHLILSWARTVQYNKIAA
jgi:hypothetical protein